MGRSKSVGAGLSLVLCLAAYGASNATTAQAAHPSIIKSGSEDVTELLRAQVPLVELANQVIDASAQGGFTGLAGAAVDIEQRTVVLYWKGALPQPIQDVLAARAADVVVDVRNAPYSYEELDAEARRLIDQVPLTPPARITRVSMLPDYSGLAVSVHPDDIGPLPLVESDIPTVVDAAPEAVFWGENEMLMIDEIDPGASSETRSRWNEYPPFRGGAAIDRKAAPTKITYIHCTTGFATRLSDGREAMLTARHCGHDKDWKSPHSDEDFGHSGEGKASLDAVAIHNKNYSPWVFHGHWNTAKDLPVKGTRTPVNGMIACTSGSSSGTSCRQRVGDVGAYEVRDGVEVGPGFWTTEIDRKGYLGRGDSGGPVYLVNGNGDGVFGLGLALARHPDDVYTASSCEGRSQLSGGIDRRCSWRNFHINLNRVLTEFNMTIQTVS